MMSPSFTLLRVIISSVFFSGEWSSYDTAVRHIQDLSEEIYGIITIRTGSPRLLAYRIFLISDKLPWDPMFYTDPAEAAKLSRGVRALTAWKPPVIPADPDAAPGTVSKENTDYVSLYAIGTDAALRRRTRPNIWCSPTRTRPGSWSSTVKC